MSSIVIDALHGRRTLKEATAASILGGLSDTEAALALDMYDVLLPGVLEPHLGNEPALNALWLPDEELFASGVLPALIDRVNAGFSALTTGRSSRKLLSHS